MWTTGVPGFDPSPNDYENHYENLLCSMVPMVLKISRGERIQYFTGPLQVPKPVPYQAVLW